MSHFTSLKTKIVDQDALLAALSDLGFGTAKVQVHEDPVPLQGYLGDTRRQRAHVIIPKQYVGKVSNDIGFERCTEGFYRTWISEFDRLHYNESWLAELTRRYAYHATKSTLRCQGYEIATEENHQDGSLRMLLRRTT